MKWQHWGRIFSLMGSFLLMLVPAWGQSVQPNELAPSWVAWKAFYDSLAFYNRRSPGADARILSDQFKLSPTQVDSVLSSGRAFIVQIREIEMYTESEIKKRYRHQPTQSGAPTDGSLTRPPTPQKSVRERATADGLLAETEGRKQIAVAQHLQELHVSLGPARSDRIQRHIVTTIMPRIKRMEPSGPPQPGLPVPKSPAERMR